MKKLTPIKGIDNVSSDDQMSDFGKNHFVRLRDAVNIDISSSGRILLRKSGTPSCNTAYKNLWQSPLHNDVFATLNGALVLLNTADWSHKELGKVNDKHVSYEVINNLVFICDTENILTFDGTRLKKLTVETPPAAIVNATQNGTLLSGKYTVAISWLSEGVESGLSEFTTLEVGKDSALELTLPYSFYGDAVNVYCTTCNGTDLRKFATLDINTRQVLIDRDSNLGRSAQFKNLSPMKPGKFLKYWQGRILTADRNIINFSQALNYHLFDERHDYITMPQRITFIQPVDSGIWVGQVDHVVFLPGVEPKSLNFIKLASQAPIPFSAIEMDSETMGEVSQGAKCVVWLSEHGYVIGTSTGLLIEPQAKQLKGITAKSGQSVRFDSRIVTIVS